MCIGAGVASYLFIGNLIICLLDLPLIELDLISLKVMRLLNLITLALGLPKPYFQMIVVSNLIIIASNVSLQLIY